MLLEARGHVNMLWGKGRLIVQVSISDIACPSVTTNQGTMFRLEHLSLKIYNAKYSFACYDKDSFLNFSLKFRNVI